MTTGLVETPFKLTQDEILISAAITVLLNKLNELNISNCTIGEVCNAPQYGFTASATREPSGPRFVRITDIKGGSIDWQSVPYCECNDSTSYDLYTGDILIARSGSVGKSFILTHIPEHSVFASYLIRIRVKEGVNSAYLYWCLQSQQFWKQIMKEQRGSAMANINSKMLIDLSFPFPAVEIQNSIVAFMEDFRNYLRLGTRDFPQLLPPLDEQRRIVARLEGLAAKIEQARELRSFTQLECKKLMSSAVDSVIADIKTSSREVTVESIAESVTDGDHQPPPKAEFGIPFLFISNFTKGKVDFGNCKWVSQEYYNSLSPSRVPKKGDVLYTTVASFGIPCLVDTSEPFCFQRHVSIIKLKKGLILPSYLTWILASKYVYDQAAAFGTGSAQITVPLKGVRQLKFPLPPLEEQLRIVAYLDSLQARVEAVKGLQAATAAELDALLPALLDKAFKGEL